ncbi:DUF4369 domain-containing protein [Dyadobacter beijingensis]|uniref:DUF4369 domain-containing protein n=1 Tax=Dyadobacter beijingensis TaxID=365489 RepID=UPI00037D9B0C|nr:DUF4369 domain-containing protein [Dyadobacter beijingensis]
MKIFLLLMLRMMAALFLFCGCSKDQGKTIVGDLKSDRTFLEGRKVYLKNWDTRLFVDSARVTGGKFSFEQATDSSGVSKRPSHSDISNSGPAIRRRI